MHIAFRFNPEKFTQAAYYVASQCAESLTRKKLFKLLYFADREHLFRYARPILNDRYINMDEGPVPFAAYDIVKHNRDRVPQEVIDDFSRHITVTGMSISASDPVATDLLSKSDMAVLDEVIERYGSRSGNYLSALSHRHKAWLDSQRNRPIDYALFFEEPELDPVKELLEENQPIRDVSKNVRIKTQPRLS